MAIVATVVNNVSVVDSRLIAEDIGIQHDNLMQNIRNYQSQIESDFGKLLFQTEALSSGLYYTSNAIRCAMVERTIRRMDN